MVLDSRSRVVMRNDLAGTILGLPATGLPRRPALGRLLRAGTRLSEDSRRAVVAACTAEAEPGAAGPARPLALTPSGMASLRVRRLSDQRRLLLLGETMKEGDLASLDPLTGLANRRGFEDRLRAELVLSARARGSDVPALLLVDLDRFKPINDAFGHPVGDALLCLVAQRLTGAVRAGDLVARLGGDEFAVLLSPGAAAAGEVLAARIVELLGRPFLVAGHLCNIGASVGIARVQHGAPQDAAALVQAADLALYQAKADGRRTFRTFVPAMAERAAARRALETELRRALPLGQFELHYQPQISVADRRLVGFEALLRWHHPERGMVPPSEFIPLAEEIGLIVPLGEWVLRTACREAARWPQEISVAVNVAPRQVENGPRLLRAVVTALEASGLPGHRLELEITESTLLRRESETLATLHSIRAMGVMVSMDDFGTGYSSLSQLRAFPFSKIKIDRSFVADLERSAESMALVRAIAALGTSLGMTTTAEGVETLGQASIVEADGCTEIQGYLISRPVPASDIDALVERFGAPAEAEAEAQVSSSERSQES